MRTIDRMEGYTMERSRHDRRAGRVAGEPLLDYCAGCGEAPEDIAELCADCNGCGTCTPSFNGMAEGLCERCAEQEPIGEVH